MSNDDARYPGGQEYRDEIHVTVRPLSDIAKTAEQLGFKLYWNDLEPRKPVRPVGTFTVRLIAQAPAAKAALERATGRSDMAIQTGTRYDESLDYLDVVRQTGEAALERAREVV